MRDCQKNCSSIAEGSSNLEVSGSSKLPKTKPPKRCPLWQAATHLWGHDHLLPRIAGVPACAYCRGVYPISVDCRCEVAPVIPELFRGCWFAGSTLLDLHQDQWSSSKAATLESISSNSRTRGTNWIARGAGNLVSQQTSLNYHSPNLTLVLDNRKSPCLQWHHASGLAQSDTGGGQPVNGLPTSGPW